MWAGSLAVVRRRRSLMLEARHGPPVKIELLPWFKMVTAFRHSDFIPTHVCSALQIWNGFETQRTAPPNTTQCTTRTQGLRRTCGCEVSRQKLASPLSIGRSPSSFDLFVALILMKIVANSMSFTPKPATHEGPCGSLQCGAHPRRAASARARSALAA
jgi:hypothetical protein